MEAIIAALVLPAITSIITVLSETLLTVGVWFTNQIISTSIRVFTAGNNVVSIFIDLLPLSETMTANLNALIPTLTWSIITFIFTLNIVRQVAKSAAGERTENPFDMLGRLFLTVAILIFIFGTGFNVLENDGILSYIGKLFNNIMIGMGADVDSNLYGTGLTMKTSVDINVAQAAGVLIAALCLDLMMVKAGLSYLGKILTFAIYTLFGPIAVSFYATKDTQSIAVNWIKNLFTQLVSIALSLFVWGLIIYQLKLALKIEGANMLEEAILLYINPDQLFQLFVAVALAGFMAYPEKILGYLGLNMPSTTDQTMSGMAMTQQITQLAHGLKHLIGGQLAKEAVNRSDNSFSASEIHNGRGSNMYNSTGGIQDEAGFLGKKSDINEDIKESASQPAGSEFTAGAEEVNRFLNQGIKDGTNHLQMVEPKNGGTNPIYVGKGESIDNTTVSGLVGNGYFRNPNLQSTETPDVKPLFIPTSFGGSTQRDISPGTKIDLGSKGSYIVGDKSYTIDRQYGTKAYELMEYKDNGSETNDNGMTQPLNTAPIDNVSNNSADETAVNEQSTTNLINNLSNDENYSYNINERTMEEGSYSSAKDIKTERIYPSQLDGED